MSAAMGLILLGPQERVRNSCGKRAISVRTRKFYCTNLFDFKISTLSALSATTEFSKREIFILLHKNMVLAAFGFCKMIVTMGKSVCAL